jgi:hypothetical protein
MLPSYPYTLIKHKILAKMCLPNSEEQKLPIQHLCLLQFCNKIVKKKTIFPKRPKTKELRSNCNIKQHMNKDSENHLGCLEITTFFSYTSMSDSME